MNIKSYIAEFVGTLVLVVFGCGAAVGANTIVSNMGLAAPLGFTTLLISFAFGLSIVAMAYSIGNVSGCHINPAVSAAMLVAGRMTVKDFVGYIIAQFAGALAGASLLMVMFGGRSNLGQNGFGEASALGTTSGVAIMVEILLTFVFVLVILEVTSKEEYSNIAGMVIGLTLTLIHILGIPFTGTSVNPARSFGPAVLAGGDALEQLPVFILAPFIGAILAALFDTYVLSEFALIKNMGDADEKNATDIKDPKESPETKTEAVKTSTASDKDAVATGNSDADSKGKSEAKAKKTASTSKKTSSSENKSSSATKKTTSKTKKSSKDPKKAETTAKKTSSAKETSSKTKKTSAGTKKTTTKKSE